MKKIFVLTVMLFLFSPTAKAEIQYMEGVTIAKLVAKDFRVVSTNFKAASALERSEYFWIFLQSSNSLVMCRLKTGTNAESCFKYK